MKKILLFLLLIIISFSSVKALEICTPSDEYLKYMSLSDEEKLLYTEPNYCKELETNEKENMILSLIKGLNNYISASFTDTKYNSYTQGYVTKPKTQGSLGTCWAFSSISAVESNALKNNIGSYDFSESHMIYSVLQAAYNDDAGKKGKYYTTNFDGGKVTYAASYYFNGFGQLYENEMPYVDREVKINSSQYKKGKKIISLGGFTLANLENYAACTSDEISYIKKQIIDYGSTQASMYMKEDLFKDSQNNYYLSNLSHSSYPNHGVSIIGWDDTISASSFNGATRNGAFIIKNSWGPSWSKDGLFYISYDDAFICKNTATFYDVSTTTFDNYYASSDMLGVPTFVFKGNFYTSAKFKKASSNDEQIRRVSFAVGKKTNYTVYLSYDNNLKNTSGWKKLVEGYSDSYGIKSVNLAGLKISNDFTIIVKYNSSVDTSIFTMCNNFEDTRKMDYSANTNFASVNTSYWADMKYMDISNQTISCEPNIYVYTNNVETPSEPDSNVTISSITNNSDKFIVNFSRTNVSPTDINYQILSSNKDMTSHFTITPDYNNNKYTFYSDGLVSGTFSFVIKYRNKQASSSFKINETISSKDTNLLKISGNNVIITLKDNDYITYQKLINNINTKNTTINVYDKNNNKISLSDTIITTNCKIKLNSSSYIISLKGDINCDGKISTSDYMEIRNHIMGNRISDKARLLASDFDSNNNVSTLDYIKLKKSLKR